MPMESGRGGENGAEHSKPVPASHLLICSIVIDFHWQAALYAKEDPHMGCQYAKPRHMYS